MKLVGMITLIIFLLVYEWNGPNFPDFWFKPDTAFNMWQDTGYPAVDILFAGYPVD